MPEKQEEQQPAWFMDCYSSEWSVFPLNSYYGDLEHLMHKGRALLERDISGIRKVSFSRSTRGCSPIQIED